MTSKAEKFEKQIKRIHDALIQDHAEVTWNDKIPDPDNPDQLRQIDITVKRNGEITHIECRSHQVPQGSKWVEELYGRKVSLQAVAMIGVSDSGFTKGAIKKAKRLGVFLCNLSQLSAEGIESWGKKTKIKWYYYTFSNLEICYFLKSIKGFELDDIKKDIFSKPQYNDSLFNQIKYQFNKDKDFTFPYGFRFMFSGESVDMLGRIIVSVSLRGDVDKVAYDYECPFVYSFHTLAQNSSSIASVEKTENPNVEIIKTTSGFSTVNFDLSIAPQAPPNSVLAGIFEFSKLPGSKKYPPKFNIIGSHEQEVNINEANFIVAEIKK